uniref:Thiamine-monophosphate kinase n=1 Tax=Geoglobus ahangari TaxID=113653 RepID=A0A7C4S738_9EURY
MEDEIIKIGMSTFKSEELGDDAGFFPINDGWLVLTNDMFVESTDYVPIMSLRDVGFKTVTMNVSDLAAMGAKPKFFAFSVGIRRNTESIENLFKGISEALNYYGMRLLSADTNESKELVVDGIALGFAENLLLRKNAKTNQLVCVTGEFGRPLCALKVVLEDLRADDAIAKVLFEKLVRPYARFVEGYKISKYATSAIDVSDGLSKELRIISEMSNVGLIIYSNRIPISREVKLFCEKNNLDPVDIALSSGEEFELIFTINEENLKKIDFNFTVIGKTVEKKGVWLKKDGRLIELEDKGWRHFL